jgi:hypothetical protein
MDLSMNVAEHWTSSRRALVVTADTATVRNLVQELELSQDVAVRVNQNRLAIALWGDDLKSYIRYRDGVLNADVSQGVPVPEYASV